MPFYPTVRVASSFVTSSKASIGRGIGRMTDMVMQKGQGTWVWSTEGDKYLDFTSGIGVTSTGHCHPTVVEAVKKQSETLVHAQVNIGFHEKMLQLVEKLKDGVVPTSLDTFSFVTSGAEAVENAIKLARHATGKQNIIVAQGGYHGRTVGAMSLTTSKTSYSAGFHPLMPGVYTAPFPYSTQLSSPLSECSEQEQIEFCLQQLRLVLKQQTAPNDTAAILMEPVLGEGGYVPAPVSYLAEVKRICEEHDILLIADEVQTGMGRTGEMFAIDGHYGIQPDVLVIAKGIASGYPLSAIATRRELADKQPPGSMGGTYAGNVISCAAALATLQVFEDEKLLQNVRERGDQLRKGLQKLCEDSDLRIKDVRGLGLMVGVEFDGGQSGSVAAKNPSEIISGKVSQACFEDGMLLLTTSIFDTVRFIPPLTVSEEEIDAGLHIFEKALRRTVGAK